MPRVLMTSQQLQSGDASVPKARVLKPATPKAETITTEKPAEQPKTSFWGDLLKPKSLDEISKETPGQAALSTTGNIAKSLVKNVGGMLTYPVYGAPKAIYEAGKEVKGAVEDISKGVSPITLAKETVKGLPKAAYETLTPEFIQKGIKEGVEKKSIGAGAEAGFKSLGEDPFQVLPYALGAKGTLEKIPVVEKTFKAPTEAIKTTIKTAKELPKKVGYEGVGIEKLKTPLTPEQKVTKFNTDVMEGVSKGIKPTVIGKPSLANMQGFYENAKTAVKTIAENKGQIKIFDEHGEQVSHPRSSAEAAQAIDQTKSLIYKKYSDMSKAAGKFGATTDVTPAISKLQEATQNIGNSPEVRKYAQDLIPEIQELQGQPPEVIEARIKEYNQSLGGFYEGRVNKSKAQIDASVANLLREQLDNSIENVQGAVLEQAKASGVEIDPTLIKNYQDLKNQYGSLKAIEKEVNKRALVNARKAGKSVIDMTDIFTGGELASGAISALSGNPAGLAAIGKGLFGRGLKEYYKSLNNPDRYIEKMFKTAYEVVPDVQNPNVTISEVPAKTKVLPQSKQVIKK